VGRDRELVELRGDSISFGSFCSFFDSVWLGGGCCCLVWSAWGLSFVEMVSVDDDFGWVLSPWERAMMASVSLLWESDVFPLVSITCSSS